MMLAAASINHEKPRLSLKGFKRTPEPVSNFTQAEPVVVRDTNVSPRFPKPRSVEEVYAIADALRIQGIVQPDQYRVPSPLCWLERQYGKLVLQILRERFPKCFNDGRLLKIGIDADLRERCPDIGVWGIKCAVKYTVSMQWYLKKFVVGAKRVDLDGVEVEEINDKAMQHAAAAHKIIRKRIEARAVS